MFEGYREKVKGTRMQSGEQNTSGEQSGSMEKGERERERQRLSEEIGLPVSDLTGLPVGEKWAAAEQRLREVEQEVRREEAEIARLTPLRLERLKKTLGQLGEEQRKNLDGAMFSEGVAKMWNVRQIATSEYRERDAAAEQREYEKDCAEAGEAEAAMREEEREAILNGQEWRAEPPLWQQISGLFPEQELGISPNRRAQGIRALLKRAEHLIRWEVRRGATDGNGDGEKRGIGETVGDSDEVRVDATRQTAQWDPLRTICLYLGIAQRKLSALSRESTDWRRRSWSTRSRQRRCGKRGRNGWPLLF